MMRASGKAKILPLLLRASQVYAPASSGRAWLIVRVPVPLTLVEITRSPSGILPQLRRHTIMGVGVPIALHLMVKVPLTSTSISGSGLSTIDGVAGKKEKHIVR